MLAFCPPGFFGVEISIPVAFITSFIPFLVSMVIPASTWESFIVIVAISVLRTLVSGMAGDAGNVSTAINVLLSHAQNPPVQIGKSELPCSNSIQTEDFSGGIKNSPTLLPAYGVHGVAQPVSLSPSTSCTVARILPNSLGSLLLVTMPRYL